MGSSTALLGSSARTYNMLSACNDALQKSLSVECARAQLCWARVHSPLRCHQRTRNAAEKSSKLEWAWAQPCPCWACVHTAELAKIQNHTRTPISNFLMTKALFPLVLQWITQLLCYGLSLAREGTLERGRGVILLDPQTLDLLYKAIAIPSLKTNKLGSRFRPFSLL